MRRSRGSRPARRLRISIDALPRATKLAMLEGIRETPIIVGAYTSPEGTCPMLAAHRRGGRTSLGTFADAWDGYTRAMTRPRPATPRELRTLESMLEASLAEVDAPEQSDLTRAVQEHRAVREREARDAVPADREPRARGKAASPSGDRDRSGELRHRPGWAWLRVFRRLDDYEAALERVHRSETPPDEPTETLAGVGASSDDRP